MMRASWRSLLYQLQQLPDSSLETIVVDGASDAACCRVCQQYGAQWLAAEPCRGQQLRTGAAVARGDALWFLHADNRLPPDPLESDAARIRAKAQWAAIFAFVLIVLALGPHCCWNQQSPSVAGSEFPMVIRVYSCDGMPIGTRAAIHPGPCSRRSP